MSPHLFYVFPWIPFPRHLIIYLRERRIPNSHVRVIAVSDPQQGQKVPQGFPPPPAGSSPILAIPPAAASDPSIPTTLEGWKLLRQSLHIMHFLESRFSTLDGWKKPPYCMQAERPSNPYMLSNNTGYQSSVEMALACWNPLRLFGSGAGPVSIPEAAKESLKWARRELAVIETYLNPSLEIDVDYGGYAERLAPVSKGVPTFGDIMLFSYLEMVADVYGYFDELTLGQRAKAEGGKRWE
ncbi:MAG: hypothetical protein LQ340_003842 [Diploschistes diacapsis]|nr:MAG: hypothetical protein LQ340_003842 [Diploschistes diacapsis]